MESIKEWLSIANALGIGATFVLGLVVWALWRERSEEKDYARKLDRETLDVLHGVTKLLESNTSGLNQHTVTLASAIKNVESVIVRHLERIEGNQKK